MYTTSLITQMAYTNTHFTSSLSLAFETEQLLQSPLSMTYLSASSSPISSRT